MKKIFIFIAIAVIIFSLIFIEIRDNFNLNKIINNIEKKTNLTINLNDESKWKYYPLITFKNNITIKDNNNYFKINKADINISKNYWPTSPVKIDFALSPQSKPPMEKALNSEPRDAHLNEEKPDE